MEAIAYARAYLANHGADETHPHQPFRRQSAHIERVSLWLERLLAPGGVEDPRAVRLAAALHDTGYASGKDGHGIASAAVVRQYAKEHGIDAQVAERAAWLVAEHSNKQQWLSDPNAPMDLILLMEADLLDEEGAMGLVLDCMTAGAQGLDYAGTYQRMMAYEPERLSKNPMVTMLGKEFWAWKQRIIRDFMAAYAFDLGIDDEA